MPAQLSQPREVEFGPDVKVLFMQTPGGLKIMAGLKGRRESTGWGGWDPGFVSFRRGHPSGGGGVDSWIPKGPSSSLFPRTGKGSELMMA